MTRHRKRHNPRNTRRAARARQRPPRPRSPRRPEPDPLETNDSRVIIIGTAVWALAFVTTLTLRGPLTRHGHAWVTWTCLAGVGLGLLGLTYTRRNRDAVVAHSRRSRDDEPRDQAATPQDQSRDQRHEVPPGGQQAGRDFPHRV